MLLGQISMISRTGLGIPKQLIQSNYASLIGLLKHAES